MAAGGTIDYEQDCSDTVFTAPLTIGPGASVDIEANGHDVVLEGNFAVRLFDVTGGSLKASTAPSAACT